MTGRSTAGRRIDRGLLRRAGVVRHEELSAAMLERYTGFVDEETARYPRSLRNALPPVLVLASAHTSTGAVRARSLIGGEALLLTPHYDFRGSLHRLVASWLLATREDGREILQRWEALGDQARPLHLYPRAALSSRGQLAALVGAMLSGRGSVQAFLIAAAGEDGGMAEALTSWLRTAVGVGSDDILQRRGSAKYGFVTSIEPDSDDFRVIPGNVRITTTPPADDTDWLYTPLAPARRSEVAATTLLDTWTLPEKLLEQTVHEVVVVDDVRRTDCDVAGYAQSIRGQPGRIVVELSGRRSTFAHELGHAIHARFHDEFPEAAWIAANPRGDDYFGDAVEYILSGVRQPDFSPALLARGFITSYGSATMNEDVAEYVEALFTGDERLWSAASAPGPVADKLEIMIGFLRNVVDPALDHHYFTSIARHRRAEEQRWGL